jgi:hypothetical protein
VSSRCSSIARAVWLNDIVLAQTHLAHSPLARVHLCVSDGVVSLGDPQSFSVLVNNTMVKESQHKVDELNKDPNDTSARRIRQRSAAARLARLWSPFDRRLVVSGIVTSRNDDGAPVVARGPDIVDALAAHWKPTFTAKPIDLPGSLRFLSEWASPFDFSAATPPSTNDYLAYLARVKNSAPGPDGIPFEAWRASSVCGAHTLFQLGLHLNSGISVPLNFNKSIMAFPPKGEEEEDHIEIRRAPNDTRPISLKTAITRLSPPLLVARYLRASLVPRVRHNAALFRAGRCFIM